MVEDSRLIAAHGRHSAVIVSAPFVADLADHLPAQTKEIVQDRLGISANTWLKIKRGQPIRRSIGEMLVRRFRLDGR